jgi:acetyl-CoA synthetase
VILREQAGDGGPDVVEELRTHVRKQIGAIASPKSIMVVAELPKTRSGKIMRRLLRDVAENRDMGDVTTLTDSSVMDEIKSGMETSGDDDE